MKYRKGGEQSIELITLFSPDQAFFFTGIVVQFLISVIALEVTMQYFNEICFVIWIGQLKRELIISFRKKCYNKQAL